MKLLVIILCLFSERFLIHGIAHQRFNWFSQYQRYIMRHASHNKLFNNFIIQWMMIILPLVLALIIILFLFGNWLWGLVGFLLNIIIFYYCLGPDNAFYPPAAELLKRGENPAQPYFERVNSQLFTPVFWYLLLGPVMLFFYRINFLMDESAPYAGLARKINSILEWIPARLTALCYLLAGHFQNGLAIYKQMFISGLNKNRELLGETGIAAARNAEENVSLPQAEQLVEQALIIYLAVFAVLIIAVWL